MFRHAALRVLACACATFVASPLGARAAASVDDEIAAHLAAVCAGLDPRPAAALERIDGLDRRLLAARAYLRSHAAIEERWSWTQAQIAQYSGSPLQRALDAEIARVRATFETQNPGYTLWVNPEVRSVELQLERFNSNVGVGRAARSVLAHVRARVAGPDAPADADAKWLAKVLGEVVPSPASPLAAPGLTRHGRMQAVDFHVRRGERTVAGPSVADVERVWMRQGWAAKLERAVRATSDRFEGPLTTPNEPWHYEYRAPPGLPSPDAARRPLPQSGRGAQIVTARAG